MNDYFHFMVGPDVRSPNQTFSSLSSNSYNLISQHLPLRDALTLTLHRARTSPAYRRNLHRWSGNLKTEKRFICHLDISLKVLNKADLTK